MDEYRRMIKNTNHGLSVLDRWWPFLFTILQSIICWGYRDVFFEINTPFIIMCRIIVTCIMCVVCYKLRNLWKQRDTTYVKSLVKWWVLYFGILMLIFVCIYPGSWRGGDEFVILNTVKQGRIDYWHHYLSYIFYAISLILIPFPAAVPFMQMIVGATVFAHIMASIQTSLERTDKSMLFYAIPFITLPVLDSIYYPMRMSVYAFLELLLHFELFSLINKNEKSYFKIIYLSILIGIVAVWRTEGIIYILIVGALFWVNKKNTKQYVMVMVLVIWVFGTIYIPQSIGSANKKAETYKYTAVITQITPLIASEYAEEPESELLSQIDKILSVDVIIAGTEKNWNGSKIFWSYKELEKGELIRSEYTEEEYYQFMMAYIKLATKRLGQFLSERIDNFLNSMPGTTLKEVPDIYESSMDRHTVFKSYVGNLPLNQKLRMCVLRLLAADSMPYMMRFLIWCVIPQIIGTMLATVICFWKKNYSMMILISSVWIRALLVFFTAPASYFMYYFSIYLIGLFWGIYWLCSKRSIKVWQRGSI